MHFSTLLAFGAAFGFSQAQVIGTPGGFAAGVTGGGSAKAAAPSDIAQ